MVCCARCDRLIPRSYCHVIMNPGASGAGADVFVCKEICTRDPTLHQPAPVYPSLRNEASDES